VTTGTVSCFDRLLFKGHLALGYDKALDGFLRARGERPRYHAARDDFGTP